MEKHKICLNCGKAIPTESLYCRFCGITVAKKCEYCNKILPIDTKVCTSCGKKTVKKVSPLKVASESLEKNSANIIIFSVLMQAVLLITSMFFPYIKYSGYRDGGIFKYSTLIYYFFGGVNQRTLDFSNLCQLANPDTPLELLVTLSAAFFCISLLSAFVSLIITLVNIKRFSRKSVDRVLKINIVTSVSLLVCSSLTLFFINKANQTLPDPKIVPGVVHYIPVVCSLLITAITLLLKKYIPAKDIREIGLYDITLAPLSALISKIHFPKRKSKDKRDKHYNSFEFTPNFSKYLIVLVASLIFTQALRSSASHLLFLFVLFLPICLLIYLLFAKLFLKIELTSKSLTSEKYAMCNYSFTLYNSSLLAFPFVEAVMSLPNENNIRCEKRKIKLAMSPFSRYNVNNSVYFKYRGEYEIGVEYLYVYDFFKIMRIRTDFYELNTFDILPRRLDVYENGIFAISDNTQKTVKSPVSYDKLEVSDIREYQSGDPLKSIHWKLSSKSEDFIVKDFNTGTSDTALVFCDFSKHFSDSDKNIQSVGFEKVSDTPQKDKKDKKSDKNKKKSRKANPDKDTYADERNIPDSNTIPDVEDEKTREIMEAHKKRAEFLSKSSNRSKSAPAINDKSTNIVPEDEVRVVQSTLLNDVDVNELYDPSMEEGLNEYLCDGVVELTISAVLQNLRSGKQVLLTWFDNRSVNGIFSYLLTNEESFNSIFRLFGTAPLCESDKSVADLALSANELAGASRTFVIPTPDNKTVADLCRLSVITNTDYYGSSEVIFYDADSIFKNKAEHKNYIESCRRQLLQNGIILIAGHLPH